MSPDQPEPAEPRGRPELAELADFALDLGCWAARQIVTTPVRGRRTKAHPADLVTDTDTAIETEVRRRLADRFPGHRLLGEEFGALGPDGAELTWYCDPVDGTTNYANGIGWCSFSLACWDAAGPLLGLVADPYRRELAVGRRGGGALVYRLDADQRLVEPAEPVWVSGVAGLAGTVVTTEWLAELPWPGMTGTIAALAADSCTVRIMGSSALSLLQVGLGRAAACIIGRYSPIDDSAAVLIGTEAGALARGIDGTPAPRPPAGILLAAPGVAAAVLAAWRTGVAAGPATAGPAAAADTGDHGRGPADRSR